MTLKNGTECGVFSGFALFDKTKTISWDRNSKILKFQPVTILNAYVIEHQNYNCIDQNSSKNS